MMNFPKDFIFGGATAAYQAEGATSIDGRGKCYWDEYLKEHANFTADEASDFYHRYKEDLDLCNVCGVNGIRISIAWTRIIPNGTGTINEKGITYYNQLIDECFAHGVEPFVTLHHFDTPLPLFKEGDWLVSHTIDSFVEYANVCFEHFGDRVTKWITINEPWSLAAGQYIVGHFPPNIHYDLGKAAKAMHNMMIAHARVVNAYKEKKYPGQIGIIHILEPKFPIDDQASSKQAALYEHTFNNRFMLDATILGAYQTETLKIVQDILHKNDMELCIDETDMAIMKQASMQLDFLGVNYYQSHFCHAYDGESNIHHNGTGQKGSSSYALKGIGEHRINPDVPTTDWDWSIYPEGLYVMLMELYTRYDFKKPIYVTENGVGEKDVLVNNTVQDDSRIAYIYGHLEAILKAVEQGVDVKGYFLWSLMDVFSWTNGYNKRYGLLYVDFNTQERFVKKSGHWYKKISTNKVLTKE